MRFNRGIIFGCLCLVLVLPLCAETLYMKDGRVIQGRIIDQSKTHVRIQTPAGSEVFSKNDIIRILYTPTEQKAEEERRRREQQKQAEEARLKELELKNARERQAKEEAERRAAEERRTREQNAEEQRLARRKLYITLSEAGGRRRTIAELAYRDIWRHFSTGGLIINFSDWNPAVQGPNLDVLAIRNSWRFEFGATYRSLNPDFVNSSFSNDALNGFKKGNDQTSPHLAWQNGNGLIRCGRFSIEREFLRTEGSSLGIQIGYESSAEKVSVQGPQGDFNSSGLSRVSYYPGTRMTSALGLGNVSVKWHRTLASGAEATISLGAIDGFGIASSSTMQLPVSSSGGGMQNSVTDARTFFRLSGPALSLQFVQPIADRWALVLTAGGENLQAKISGLEGQFLSPSSGGNPSFVPLGFLSTCPSWITAHPLHMTIMELSAGIRRSFE